MIHPRKSCNAPWRQPRRSKPASTRGVRCKTGEKTARATGHMRSLGFHRFCSDRRKCPQLLWQSGKLFERRHRHSLIRLWFRRSRWSGGNRCLTSMRATCSKDRFSPNNWEKLWELTLMEIAIAVGIILSIVVVDWCQDRLLEILLKTVSFHWKLRSGPFVSCAICSSQEAASQVCFVVLVSAWFYCLLT